MLLLWVFLKITDGFLLIVTNTKLISRHVQKGLFFFLQLRLNMVFAAPTF